MLSGSSFKEHSGWNKSFAQCKSVEEIGRYNALLILLGGMLN